MRGVVFAHAHAKNTRSKNTPGVFFCRGVILARYTGLFFFCMEYFWRVQGEWGGGGSVFCMRGVFFALAHVKNTRE